MDDLFFVMQLYSYPGDYLADNPTIERLAETLDKFEEDVLGARHPFTVRGRRTVSIRFGKPLLLPTGKRESAHGNGTHAPDAHGSATSDRRT